ncbi:MAG: copper resistance CopC/CopD family protein [Gemmatimonadota bacterium]
MNRVLAATTAALLLSVPPASVDAAARPHPVPTSESAPTGALHTELESSTPARDTTVGRALERVVLVFSGPVEARLSRIRWVGPAGDTVSLEISAAADRPHVLIGEAPPAMNGMQRLIWRTVSIDGHQVNGEIPFVVDAPGLPRPETGDRAQGTAEPAGRDTLGREAGAAPGDADVDRAEGPSTARLAVGGFGLFCLLGFAGLLWFGSGSTILDEPRSHRLASILGLAASLLLALDVVLWLSELRMPGSDLAATFGLVLDTRSGLVEIGRVALAGLAFLLFAGTRGVKLGAVVAMLAVVVGALGGHQASIRPLVSLPANGLHLGAAAVWTGGILLLGVWPSRPETAAGVGWTFRRVALRVSTAAFWASAAILVTAVVQDLLYLPSIGAIFTSEYGKLLLAKGAGFAALIGFGAYNRLRLIPALDEAGAGAARLRRSVRLELIIVIVVVLVAVALGQVPPPVE